MYVYLAAAVALLVAGHIFKAIRWKQIVGTYEDVHIGSFMQILAIGQGVNMVLPFRIGDLARIVLLKKDLKNGYVLSVASVVVDLFIDTITVGLAFCTLYLLDIHRSEVAVSAVVYGTLSSLSAVFLCMLSVKRKMLKLSIYQFARLFNENIERRLLMAAYTIFSSTGKLMRIHKIFVIIGVTVGVWLCYFASYGYFALFLQNQGFDFTLTKVFNTIFSIAGDSLLLSVFQWRSVHTWGIWFVLYLFIPIVAVRIISALLQNINMQNTESAYYILPQLMPNDRLAFLSAYFNSDDDEHLKAYLEINNGVNVLNDCSAGSNATTILCMNENDIFFRKYAFGADAEKLFRQRQWLKKYDDILPLAKVINEKSSARYFYYDMEYRTDAKSFFNYIHASAADGSWRILKDVLDVLADKLYSRDNLPCDACELKKYISQKVHANLKICNQWINEMFPELYNAGKVYINGTAYNNLRHYDDFFETDNLFNIFKHDVYAPIHGDLTIENIVCTNSGRGWYLIDPNDGNLHETPYLDFAKILQSLHGRYEFFMMVDKGKVYENHIEFMHTYSNAYAALYDKYELYLQEKFQYMELKSIYCHEIVHWLRLMPYKIRKRPETAIVFYAGMLMILSDIEERFCK